MIERRERGWGGGRGEKVRGMNTYIERQGERVCVLKSNRENNSKRAADKRVVVPSRLYCRAYFFLSKHSRVLIAYR